jgi:ABC-2 type transport system ATP-binding protein
MIKIDSIVKCYGDFRALDKVSFEIPSGTVYGLVGVNGAGKSTLLRTMAGIFKPEGGKVTYDGQAVFDNPDVKKLIAFVPDDLYLPPNQTILDMARRYEDLYDRPLNREKLSTLAKNLELNMNQRFSTFSKGMRRQASTILALSLEAEYIFFDETFDGLDPVMRLLVKRILAEEVATKGLTPVIASHNLREIEDICDHIGLLHEGGILFESEIDALKSEIHTVQGVFDEDKRAGDIFSDFHIVSENKRGSLMTAVVRGDKDAIENAAKAASPKYFEIIPLTLEEIFISEMEERGYDYSKVVF